MRYFLLFVCISFNLYSQDPYAINYTLKDGLQTNTIYAVFQDKKGFVWLATDVGVVKYDSKNFTLFNTDKGLTDNEVFKIKEDFKGRKWLLTLNGIPSYIKNDTIYNEQNSTIIQQIKNKSMLIDFYQDAAKNIYLVSKNGKVTIIREDDSVEEIIDLQINTFGIWKVGNRLSILSSLGIYNPTNKTFEQISTRKTPHRVFNIENETYYADFNTLYFISSDGKTKNVVTLKEEVEIINIYKESNTKFWICTRKGLYLFEDKKIKNQYFKDKIITSISKDIENNYWITTLNNGLFLVPSFSVFQKKIKINTIAKKSNDEIWFGGVKNDFYIKKKNKFEKREFNKSWRKDVISKIRFFNNETYVIGKAGVEKITPKEIIETPININDLIEKEDTFLLATRYTSKILKNDLIERNYEEIYQKRILDRRTKVFEKGRKSIYIGTNIGLYTYDSLNNVSFLGNHFKELKSSINNLLFDAENNLLLVATSSKGLIVLENEKLKFLISNKDKLNNNTVISIEKIKKNQYLVGTNKGINLLIIDNDTFKILNYNASLAFKNQKINAICYANDTIYIATNNSLIYFNQNYLYQKKNKPLVFIDKVSANNVAINIDGKKEIAYQNNNIKIDFTGISFLDEGDLEFHYQLNNKPWSTTQETQLNFNTLASNSYVFSMYAVNGFNEKSNIQTILFTIKKPFWQTWSFILLCVFLFGFIVYYFINKRLKYVEKQFIKEKKSILLEKENIELENQMLALEQKALRLQMNPHFIFNALNTIKGYYSEGNVKEASNYISNFSKLLRLLLENVEQYIPLSLEIEMLNLYIQLVQVRYQNKFNYKIIVDKSLNIKETGIPTLLMQPIIENAIIHGVSPKNSTGNILISFNKKDDTLICVVSDDGIGMEKSKQIKKRNHNSKAIKITKERLDLIEVQENTTCSLQFVNLTDNEKSIGTKVVITIPFLKIW
jgi:sensor histidine kinase YesM